MDETMQLFYFDVSFSLCYHLSVGTELCSLNRAAKFVISVLHWISTELRKLCSNLAAIKKNWKKNAIFELRLK